MIKIRTQRDQRDIIEMTVLSELYVCFLIDLVAKRASLRLSFRSVNLFKRPNAVNEIITKHILSLSSYGHSRNHKMNFRT